MHYVVPIVSQPIDSLDNALHSYGSQSPDLSVEIAQPP